MAVSRTVAGAPEGALPPSPFTWSKEHGTMPLDDVAVVGQTAADKMGRIGRALRRCANPYRAERRLRFVAVDENDVAIGLGQVPDRPRRTRPANRNRCGPAMRATCRRNSPSTRPRRKSTSLWVNARDASSRKSPRRLRHPRVPVRVLAPDHARIVCPGCPRRSVLCLLRCLWTVSCAVRHRLWITERERVLRYRSSRQWHRSALAPSAPAAILPT